jgi:hypothetical protein
MLITPAAFESKLSAISQNQPFRSPALGWAQESVRKLGEVIGG